MFSVLSKVKTLGTNYGTFSRLQKLYLSKFGPHSQYLHNGIPSIPMCDYITSGSSHCIQVVNHMSIAVTKTSLLDQECIEIVRKIQKRTLVNKVRRPVPFGLANTFYTKKIKGETNTSKAAISEGVLVLAELHKTENPKEEIKVMKTEELMSCLYAWPKQKTGKLNVGDLYRKNDVKPRSKHTDLNLLLQLELGRRVRNQDLQTLLHCAHAAFKSEGSTLRYLPIFFEHLKEHFESLPLTPEDTVKIFFYLYYFGDAPEALIVELEQYISSNIDLFSFDDFHIIVMGFFRVNKRITDFRILDKMAESVLPNLNNMDGVVSVLKIFRHSGFTKASFFMNLADKLTELKLKNVTTFNQLMHLAMTFGSLKIYHKELFDHIVLRSAELLKDAKPNRVRTKDFGRLVWALGTFNHDSKDFINSQILPHIYNSTKRKEGKLFPESLVEIAMGLVYLGEFPDVLLDTVLSPGVAAKLRDHPLLEKTNQLLFLNNSLRIEHPDYRGNVLSEAFIKTLPNKVYGDLKRERSFRQGLESSYTTLINLLGKDYVRCHFILSHFHTADLEIHLDANNQPILIESRTLLSNQQSGGLTLAISSEPFSRLTIQIIGQNQCAASSEHLLGTTQTKLRQLQKIGYKTHLIMPSEAKELDSMNAASRKEYYKSILQTNFGVEL